MNATFAIDEDVPLSSSLVATDADGDPLTFSLVMGPSAGDGTLAVQTSGTFRFTPAANFNGQTTFTFKANDGTDDSNIATVTIDVAPVSDPPTKPNNVALDAIDEDVATTANDETKVSQLVTDSGSTDPDAATGDPSLGIAIVAADTSHGDWEYTTDSIVTNVTVWQSVGNVSPVNALLLDATASVRFMPDPDFNETGTDVPTISLRLDDKLRRPWTRQRCNRWAENVAPTIPSTITRRSPRFRRSLTEDMLPSGGARASMSPAEHRAVGSGCENTRRPGHQ